MQIGLIVKVDSDNLIGDSVHNRMPREGMQLEPEIVQANRADMKHFVQLRKQTNGQSPSIVIMGRKTRDSIPVRYRPFDDNINCIISRTLDTSDLGDIKNELVKLFNNIEGCLDRINIHYRDSNVNIIGGGQIYQYVLDHNMVDTIYLTRLNAKFDGDVYFPVLGDTWQESSREDFFYHSFITYKKSTIYDKN